MLMTGTNAALASSSSIAPPIARGDAAECRQAVPRTSATPPRCGSPTRNHQQLPADQPMIPRPTALAGWIQLEIVGELGARLRLACTNSRTETAAPTTLATSASMLASSLGSGMFQRKLKVARDPFFADNKIRPAAANESRTAEIFVRGHTNDFWDHDAVRAGSAFRQHPSSNPSW
jgi:hypothetical protein